MIACASSRGLRRAGLARRTRDVRGEIAMLGVASPLDPRRRARGPREDASHQSAHGGQQELLECCCFKESLPAGGPRGLKVYGPAVLTRASRSPTGLMAMAAAEIARLKISVSHVSPQSAATRRAISGDTVRMDS